MNPSSLRRSPPGTAGNAARGSLRAALALALSALPLHAQASSGSESTELVPGHSSKGHAFDEGPRQKPWKMEGIGQVHFPITTRVPEVQEWFDQGVALLHDFWFYEAERTFRWCVKLDPDCAMAYWGLALAVERGQGRFEPILAEALARKDGLPEREQLWIEAWVGARAPWLEGRFGEAHPGQDEDHALVERMERLVVRYPDDLEAKAFYALAALWSSARVANEALLQEILAQAPQHPGAHHYRIHNWDDSEEGGVALESCQQYGRIAWDVGHANHMPGHVFSGLGMWREAGIWMESATRIELRQMRERQLFPFDYWNFAHNRNYLSYIQEQQGLVEQALLGARTLLSTPTNPKKDAPRGNYVLTQGKLALVRGLLKFERWDEVLRAGSIPWSDDEGAWRAYAETLAHLGRGDLPAAIRRSHELEELVKEAPEGGRRERARTWFREVDALVRLRSGRELEGLSELEQLARTQAESYRREDDPPDDRCVLHGLLGELYLERGAPALALACFERQLELVRNDGFALSGLARAHAALGHTAEASRAWGRLQYVWAGADPGLRWMESARALGLQAEPIDESPGEQREYRSPELAPELAAHMEALGPIAWEPFPAPELDAVGADGARMQLADLAGKNVVLVFYLGGQCVHCVEELAALANRAAEFAALDTVLVAVSADPPEELARPEKLAGLEVRLGSDHEHASARRYRAWDDFEEIPLHATILIDRAGNERWARVGGDPWDDVDFLLKEIGRWNQEPRTAGVPAPDGAGTR